MNIHNLYTNVHSCTARAAMFAAHVPFHSIMFGLHIAGALIQATTGISVGAIGVVQENISNLVINLVNGARNVFGDLILIGTNPSPVDKLLGAPKLIEDTVSTVETGVELVNAAEQSHA